MLNRYICTLENSVGRLIGFNVDAKDLTEASKIIKEKHPDKKFLGCIVKELKVTTITELC